MRDNPQMAAQMRDMLSDPQRLQAMMNPRAQAAMQQMAQVSLCGGGDSQPGWAGPALAGPASQPASPRQPAGQRAGPQRELQLLSASLLCTFGPSLN
jgi:hypothetical protein